jgi:hypothetical protein
MQIASSSDRSSFVSFVLSGFAFRARSRCSRGTNQHLTWCIMRKRHKGVSLAQSDVKKRSISGFGWIISYTTRLYSSDRVPLDVISIRLKPHFSLRLVHNNCIDTPHNQTISRTITIIIVILQLHILF